MFDPDVDFSKSYSEMFTSRGVAVWAGVEEDSDQCRTRVFVGTFDARLIAVDANTGEPCVDFGKKGQIDLSAGIRRYRKWDYSLTSPPTVVGDLVIVGSAIGDNGAANLEPGLIRAFDVRNGSLAWLWDPIPRSESHPASASWSKVRGNRTGAANVWSVISADSERDLVFSSDNFTFPRFLRRKANRRQCLRKFSCSSKRFNREVCLGLSDHPSRLVGLRSRSTAALV